MPVVMASWWGSFVASWYLNCANFRFHTMHRLVVGGVVISGEGVCDGGGRGGWRPATFSACSAKFWRCGSSPEFKSYFRRFKYPYFVSTQFLCILLLI